MAEPSENETHLDGVLDATIDTVLAVTGVWLLLSTVVMRTTPLVGSPVTESTLQFATALIAFGTIYPFVTGLWPLQRFIRFLGIAAIALLAISFVTFFVLAPIAGIPAALELLQFGILAVSLVGAAAVSVLRDQ